MESPDDNYTLRELNDHLIKNFGVDDPPLSSVWSSQSFVLKLADSYNVDLTISTLHEVQRLDPREHDVAEQEPMYIANFTRGVNSIYIR